jgi:hypothetical protein
MASVSNEKKTTPEAGTECIDVIGASSSLPEFSHVDTTLDNGVQQSTFGIYGWTFKSQQGPIASAQQLKE